MQPWRDALIAVSELSGWDMQNYPDEAKLIQHILQKVLNELNRPTLLDVAKHPVGIDFQIHHMNLLSRIMSDGITMIGIFGIGGMGKTTFAKALYNKIVDQFEGCVFIENVREASKQFNGLIKLQEMLLSKILMDDLIKVRSLDRGINIIKDGLQSKKILLVLDNVDASQQLEVLAGGRDWFGMGSKVIVTTRDKHLLSNMEFDVQHPIQELSNDKALELFSWYAFKKSYPSSYEYLYYSIRAVNYCKGLPLALKVLGSLFCGRNDLSIWEDTLSAYEKKHFLHKHIQAILQISYDGLEAQTKEIFLDISCFLIGKHINDVEAVFLKECGSCPKKGITDLEDLSLLTINKASRKIEMHDLIQEMGCTIAHLEFTQPRKRKRLFTQRDVEKVLNDNKKTTAVQAIKLNFDQPTELDIDTRGFGNLKDLKFLEFQNVTFSADLEYLCNTLKWIDWPKFPFSSFPPSYTAENLIQLKLHDSSIKHLGKGFRNFECLKSVDLNRSWFLEEIPDFSSAVNLENLSLCYCRNLVMVHESVGSLSKLEDLVFEGCSNLQQLPSYLMLKSLKSFRLDGCKKLEKFPDIGEEMKSTECAIYMDDTSIVELPPSIYFLSGLTDLFIRSNSRFCRFPFSFPSQSSSFFKLKYLYLNHCNLSDLSFLEDLSRFAPSLLSLELSENKFSSLPLCIVNFMALRVLLLSHCTLLEEIPKIPTGVIRMHTDGCISMTRFPNNIIDVISHHMEQVVDEDADIFWFPSFKTITLMNYDVPEWYDYKSGNNLIHSLRCHIFHV